MVFSDFETYGGKLTHTKYLFYW